MCSCVRACVRVLNTQSPQFERLLHVMFKLTDTKFVLKFDTMRICLASGLQSNDCEKIVVLTGAGCSTDSGIPDYRSDA